MSNFTIDDTGPPLIYGSGWGISSPSDPAIAEYFQNTYHATKGTGANVSLTFNGTAVYVFGSKGPVNGDYSVTIDGEVEPQSGQQQTQEYRAILFTANLKSGLHLLTLTNTDQSGEAWLDLDFITVTGSSSSSSSNAVTSTISPPVRPSTSSVNTVTVTTSDSASTTSGTNQSPIKSSQVPIAPVIVLAILLFLALLGGCLYILIRKKSTPSTSPLSISQVPREAATPGSAFLRPQQIPPPTPPTYDPRQQGYPVLGASPLAPVSEVASDTGHSSSTSILPTSPHSRTGLMGFKGVFGHAKSDGTDSMRSTFLQVG